MRKHVIGQATKKRASFKQRNRMQIVSEMLAAASERSDGLTTTKLMHKARLSFSLLKDYLDSLVVWELLDYHTDTKRYTVTTKGLKFLRIYRNITKLFPSD